MTRIGLLWRRLWRERAEPRWTHTVGRPPHAVERARVFNFGPRGVEHRTRLYMALDRAIDELMAEASAEQLNVWRIGEVRVRWRGGRAVEDWEFGRCIPPDDIIDTVTSVRNYATPVAWAATDQEATS